MLVGDARSICIQERPTMDIIEINRTTVHGASGPTFGEISLNGKPIGVTLEPEFTSGKLIPAGTYRARLYNSPKFGRTVILLSNVPGFDAIEIHAGNTKDDTKGCILVGAHKSGNRISDSSNTLNDILTRLHAPTLQVIVR